MLKNGVRYHVYNRGNNRELLFRERNNYRYFLALCRKYVLPAVDISAWCLLPNHYHFMAYIRTEEEQYQYYCDHLHETEVVKPFRRLNPSNCFRTAFSTYAMSYNRRYNRVGSLFQDGFKHKEVRTLGYCKHLVHYIHYNPAKHELTDAPEMHPWSSLAAFLDNRVEPWLKSDCLHLFDSGSAFKREYESLDPRTLTSSWA